MLFGSQAMKPKGLFGLFDPRQAAIPIEQTAPQAATPSQAVTPAQAAMLPPKKPGFFAEGGLGRQIAGVLGDSILQAQGQQPIYLQNLMQQKALKQRQKMMQEQRAADWEDWQRRQQWTLDHKQAQPHYWESNDGSLMSIGADGQPQRVYSDPTPKYNWIPDGMGGGRYEAIPGTGGAPQYPAAPVGKLIPIGGVSGNTGGGFPVGAKATGFDSYKSGSYSPLEVAAGKEFGVPPEILARLRVRGERSNANQVSEVGARTVYQVTPETRQLIIQKYKFDPWSSPENSARGAAIVARDMYRKFGNWNDAMTGYHGGGDTRNWGPLTRAYADRTNY